MQCVFSIGLITESNGNCQQHDKMQQKTYYSNLVCIKLLYLGLKLWKAGGSKQFVSLPSVLGKVVTPPGWDCRCEHGTGEEVLDISVSRLRLINWYINQWDTATGDQHRSKPHPTPRHPELGRKRTGNFKVRGQSLSLA